MGAKARPVQLKLKLTRGRLSPWWDVGEPSLRFWEMKAELLGLEVPKNDLAPLLAAVSASPWRGAWECGCFIFIVTLRAQAGRETLGWDHPWDPETLASPEISCWGR